MAVGVGSVVAAAAWFEQYVPLFWFACVAAMGSIGVLAAGVMSFDDKDFAQGPTFRVGGMSMDGENWSHPPIAESDRHFERTGDEKNTFVTNVRQREETLGEGSSRVGI